MTMSQLSQPSASISGRLMGRKGAGPKRLAQNGRQLVIGLAGAAPHGLAARAGGVAVAGTVRAGPAAAGAVPGGTGEAPIVGVPPRPWRGGGKTAQVGRRAADTAAMESVFVRDRPRLRRAARGGRGGGLVGAAAERGAARPAPLAPLRAPRPRPRWTCRSSRLSAAPRRRPLPNRPHARPSWAQTMARTRNAATDAPALAWVDTRPIVALDALRRGDDQRAAPAAQSPAGR